MKTLRSQLGPFLERPYYEREEIERICSDALRALDLLPSAPGPIRIDRFVERRFCAPVYADLDEGVLGYTKFGPGGVEEIVISEALDRDSSQISERRIRSTLAHEAGHGLLHAHLFAFQNQRSLFGNTAPEKPKVLCRDEPDVSQANRYKGNWWEWQANRAIGALLLPQSLVVKTVAPFLQAAGSLSVSTLVGPARIDAVRELARVFEVSNAVAGIRIDELYAQTKTQPLL